MIRHDNTLVAARMAPIFNFSIAPLCAIIIFVFEGQRQERK